MPKTQVSCPNCRLPVPADVDQLFDLNVDPAAKQRLLSGAVNFIQCQSCGFQGNLSTPVVYHDPEKELLLSFVPPEINLPRDEQERLIGGLITQVVNNLPQEKRKGYLFSPQANLTFQSMIELILEADGITREMIDAQQKKLSLIQRLAGASDESVRDEIAQQEDELVDGEFFSLLSRLIEAAMASGDQGAGQQLSGLQQSLLSTTTYGRELREQSKEVEAAIADLRAAGDELTREKMLDLVVDAPNETRLQALVSLARGAMDYTFFQLFSDRIDRSSGDGRSRLVELRTKLLEMTQEIDRQVESHVQEIRQIIETILQADNVIEALQQNLALVDEYFVRELNKFLEEARQAGDLERSSKLGQMIDVLEKASSGPPELTLIEAFLDIEDDPGRQAFLQENQDEITPSFMELLANIAVQVQNGDDPDLAERAMAANRAAMRYSMSKSMSS
ncbi:CpXC domain-containing protein [Chloroflexota bacterium]